MAEYTAEQRAGIQILSHVVRRMAVYDPDAAELADGKRKEIRAEADEVGLPSAEDFDTMVEEAKARAATVGSGWEWNRW